MAFTLAHWPTILRASQSSLGTMLRIYKMDQFRQLLRGSDDVTRKADGLNAESGFVFLGNSLTV